MAIYNNILELIGETPIVRINHLDTGPCELYIKLELQNPGGSVKDRIGLKLIEDAEARGDLRPGMTIVEGTAGNTGLALALVAAQKGYRLLLVIPDKMSHEKIAVLKAMGAEVIMTRSDVARGHPEYYLDMGRSLAEEINAGVEAGGDGQGAWFVNQFSNPSNPAAHEESTGPEIWRQMDADLDAIVLGAGSSGTLAGISAWAAKHAPELELILADPEGSILTEYVNTGSYKDKSASWKVEGIGEDFLPDISDFSRVQKAFSISDTESFHTVRELLHHEGIMAGSSTGTLLAAALQYCREQTEPKKVLTLAADTGNRYLSKVYNDRWMREQGLMETPFFGDLRDLIARPWDEKETVVVGPKEPLGNAFGRMRLYDVSQLPVMDGSELVGLITDEDMLNAIHNGKLTFSDSVEAAMVRDLMTVSLHDDWRELAKPLAAGVVVVVKDNEQFIGLITRIDFLGWLSKNPTE